ncbi:killer cell lectin-like receptor subfamily F member 1 [Malaclemys terrapin pileata]|uniref:killer cell lectin-like receptor subfamily F member 1 n=1 Tax=Malaclemys terrapin pileata TaxID=2991368 RepID=UPI0023A7F970|nr:killer cell lectin-like receptor subfamily F member 1 [Malaclemys terrapin pileata]
MMEDEEGYTVLNLRPKRGRSDGPSPVGNQGSRQCPGWLQVALGAGNLILSVILLAVCVSHLVSEKGQTPAAPGSDGAGSRDTLTAPGGADPSTAECSTCLERFRSQLCHPAPPGPAGGSGCKLCPTDWRLRGDKCYGVVRGSKTWSESRANCSARGSQLLVIRDPEELEFLKDLTQSSHLFWIGLSISSPEKAWTWLDGSRLDQTLFPVSGPAEGNSCGAVKGNQIHSETCSSAFQWICQIDAVLL